MADVSKVDPGKGGKAQDKKSAMSAAVSGTEAIRTWDDHRIGVQGLADRLKTNTASGLSGSDAAERAKVHGENALSKKDVTPWYILFLKEMTGFFSLLLWFGAVLCFIGYAIQADQEDKSNLYLGIVLAAVTWLTGCFSYAQTSKSAEMMAQFENFIPPVAQVIRDENSSPTFAKLIIPE